MKLQYRRNHRKIMNNSRLYPLATYVCCQVPRRTFFSRISVLVKRFVPGMVALLLIACGGSETQVCEAGPCYLVGDHTQEEAQALSDVTRAIVAAGFTEPGYAINFVHSPDTPFKGTTWAEWRVGGIEPTDPEVGYGGWCDRPWCMVFINRCGSKGPHLYSLLVHELTHALGYDHGDRMQEVEWLINSCRRSCMNMPDTECVRCKKVRPAVWLGDGGWYCNECGLKERAGTVTEWENFGTCPYCGARFCMDDGGPTCRCEDWRDNGQEDGCGEESQEESSRTHKILPRQQAARTGAYNSPGNPE